MNDRIAIYFHRIVAHPWRVLLASVVLVGVAAIGARHTRVDYGVEQFFLPSGPEREAFERYRRSFPNEDAQFTLFWKDQRSPGQAMYRDMERAAALFERAGLHDIRWIGNAQIAEQASGDRADDLSLQLLMDPEKDDRDLAAALTRHRHDPLLQGFLWDSSQTVFAIHGYIEPSQNHDAGRRAVEESLTRGIAGLGINEAELVLGGLPVARSRAPKLLAADLRFLAGAAVMVAALVLLYFLRNPTQVLLMISSIAPAYLCTLGLMGFLGKPISLLTSFIPVVVLVIGMCDNVHLVAEFRGRLRGTASIPSAVATTFSSLAVPCFYTSLTSAIGFGGLATTRIGIVVDFGVYTAVAIMLTYGFSMTLLPALLSLTRRRTFDDRGLEAVWLGKVIGPAARRVRMGRWQTFGLFGAASLVAIALGSGLRINTLLIDDIKKETPVMRDIRWIERHGFALFQLSVHLRQTGERPLHDPAVLAWMQEFRRVAEREPIVQKTVALPDLLTPIRSSVIGSSSTHELPATKQEAAELVLMAEMSDPAVVHALYRQDQGEAQVIVAIRDTGSVVLQPFLERMESYVKSHSLSGVEATVTGTPVMIQSFTARLLANLGPSVLLDIVLISVVMMQMFRSVRVGLLAVVPNVFPLLVLLGAMRIGGFDLKPSTILVFSIAYGMAVDNTIHLLSRFLEVARSAATPEAALEASLKAAGRAMVLTSVVVIAGFAVLLISHFQVLFLIGAMTVISAVAALAADLFLLPALLALAWRRRPALTAPLVAEKVA
ncbi:MAG: MMPL family transporter [Gemmatimonadetes bacterium]|nr:MMPL family transporter [Gemmatimonadota bacterium]